MRPQDVPFEETRAPESAPPPLRHLLGQREERLGWIRYHVSNRAIDALEAAIVFALRLIPMAWVSRLGLALGALTGKIHDKRPYVQHMRRGIDLISGLGPDQVDRREAVLADWWRNAGMVRAQYAITVPLGARLGIEGRENADAAMARGRPVMILSVHLGNWELVGALGNALFGRGQFAMPYQPQPSRFHNRLIYAARKRIGFYALPPSSSLARRLHALVARGGTPLIMFVDEVHRARNQFPLFGRPHPEHGNLVYGLRLAQKFDMTILPVYFLCKGPNRTVARVLAPLPAIDSSQDGEEPGDWLPRQIEAVNMIFEPLVREHLKQWYMLQAIRIP